MLGAIQRALELTRPEYCLLSNLDFATGGPIRAHISKYQERVLAYEFYHQLRLLMEKGLCAWDAFLQAEVSKEYQHIFAERTVPDFLIHVPGTLEQDHAVIEVKLAARPLHELRSDQRKLLLFRGEHVRYQYLVQILAGSEAEVTQRRQVFTCTRIAVGAKGRETISRQE